jgi:putative ABC transport system permease protein
VCPKRRDKVAPGSTPLDEKSVTDVLLGKALIESLEAKQGGSLTMLSATKAGPANALDVTVHGALPSRFIAESKRKSTVTLAYAQDLLRMDGRVTEYVLNVNDMEHAEVVAARVRQELGPEYDVDTWREMAPIARDMAVRLRVVLVFIALILFLLVLSGIINTMLMNVYERVREIGTMLAVGVRRRQILTMFLVEAMALGLGGGAIGALAGWLLIRKLGHGVHLQPPGGDPTVMFPFIEGPYIAKVVAAAVAGALIAALYPAWKASRLKPVEALRAT